MKLIANHHLIRKWNIIQVFPV